MNDDTNIQLKTKTANERSLVADDIFFSNLPTELVKQVFNLVIENRLRKSNDGKNYTLYLNPSEKFTDEQIEALKFLFATKSFEVIIETGEPDTKDIADKAFDTLLFIAAMICPANERDELVGHLTERYYLDVKSYGERKAKVLLARDVVTSWLPKTQDSTRAKIVKIIVRIGLEIVLKQFFG
jgi:hypothetical protein